MSFFSKWLSTATVQGLCRELRVTVPWGHIAAKTWGNADGWPVLCLHGWADNANSFDRLIPLLPESEYLVTILIFTIYGLNWNRFSILGHSLGGNVGGMFCSVFPEMVDKLIVLDGFGFFPNGSSPPQERLKAAITELLKLEREQGSPRVYTPDAALKRLLQGNKSISDESGKILLQRGATEVHGGLVFTRDLRINLHSPARLTLDQCLEFQKTITAEVLLIIAKDGEWKEGAWSPDKSPYSFLMEGYRKVSKQFLLTEVEGSHHVHLNEPERVAGLISDFLKADIVSKL
ncbi:serine hydrolase-like protein [Rhinoraja longicauda]